MKLRRIISLALTALLMLSVTSVGVSAYVDDLAPTGYFNQSYLENYASAASSVKDLGCTYTKEATTFKVWAPEATGVSVKMYTTGTDAESGAAVLGAHEMTYNSSNGVWSLTLDDKDYKNTYYTYIVDRNGVISETQDPYATAVGANGNRSMVCDLDSTDPDGWDQDEHVFFDNPGEAVVWEVHVRDFSIDPSSGVSEANRGKYLAFTEGDTTVNGEGNVASCIDYLVEHNVTCVQLMPIEDFASIDETDDAIKRNWGYDPKNYNVPEGSYSSDPYDGNTRITEFKMLVQALHDRGIAVVMDVVYNHTFVLEGSSLNLTTPNYYYRKADTENYVNGSGLGNVLSSEKKMTSKYISDSLQYWVKEYHIDGFRFDLMGCFDVPNLRVWRQDLDKIDRRILMYGEPWGGGPTQGIDNALNAGNLSQVERVGAFNQTYSDSLKGNHGVADSEGFLNGGSDSEVYKAAAGQASYFPGASVVQHINYVDNHDNLTAFDKILASNKTPGFKPGKDGTVEQSTASLYETNKNIVNNPSSQVLNQMKLALTSSLTSQGIPFTVAGTEFCRTKYGDANSYRTPDEVNAIDWTRAEKYSEVSDYYAGLVAIRKAFSTMTDTKSDSTTVVSGCTAWKINNNKAGQWKSMIVALNNTASAKSVSLSGSWTIIANGKKAGTTSLGTASGSYSVPAYSGVILVDSASFGDYTQPNPGIATVTVEHYTRDSESDSYSKVKTETAAYKEGQTWRASKNLAILFDHDLDSAESTEAGNATYGSVVAGSNITVKYYYTRYIKSDYLIVRFFDTVSGERIKTPIKYRLRDGDEFSIPATSVQAYELDSTRYPAMTRGTFDASGPLYFDFYYKALTNTSTRVHYYIASTKFANIRGTILCYAYDDNGEEPLGDWPSQTKATAGMKNDDSMGAGWKYIDIPATSCYVMFHYNDMQVPGQGEKGYPVSGEAWIKDGVVTFNNKIVTSHIDLETGDQVAPDVVKEYTGVSTNQVYTTSPKTTLNRKYVVPANASGFYSAGVTNVAYLYMEENEITGDGDIMGDVDLDGDVAILDATLIQRFLANLDTLSERSKAISDVDEDDDIAILDATEIQRWLANLSDNTIIGTRIGGGGNEGKHTFSDFVDLYNELSNKLKEYDSRKYGSDPNYQAAVAALSTYRSVTQNPAASAEDIDAGYEACDNAYKGLDDIVPITEDIVTVYFTNNKHWATVYYHCWGTAGNNGWPGEQATYVMTNEYTEDIYSVTLDLMQYDQLVFTDGTQKTVDISPSLLNGNAIYLSEPDEEGAFTIGTWNFDPDNPGGGGGDDDPVFTDGKMYFAPGDWLGGGRYAAYFFNEAEAFTWVNMKYVSENLYSVNIPEGYSKVIFCKMSGANAVNSWDNKLLQTEDLDIDPGTTYYN